MNFLENIFERLGRSPERPVLVEMRPDGNVTATAQDLLERVAAARRFLADAGLRKGDRCVLLSANGIAWVACDLAAMAEGIIVVPLYARQAPGELAAMVRDCQPRLICCGDAAVGVALRTAWSEAAGAAPLREDAGASLPRVVTYDEVFANTGSRAIEGTQMAPVRAAGGDVVAIIYTSGTSGEAKGVMLTVANVTHMLGCTTARLDQLIGGPFIGSQKGGVPGGSRGAYRGSVSLFAILFRGVVDIAAVVPFAREHVVFVRGPGAAGRGPSRGEAGVLLECAGAARADARGGGRAVGEGRRDYAENIRQGEERLDGAAERGARGWRDVAGTW